MNVTELYDYYISACFTEDIEQKVSLQDQIVSLSEEDKRTFSHSILGDCRTFMERTEDSNTDLYQMFADQFNIPRQQVLESGITEIEIYQLFIRLVKSISSIVLTTHVCDSCVEDYNDVVRWLEKLS